MMKILWLLGTLATVYGVEFEIYNYDGGDVWVGIQGSDGSENLKNGGFILGSGQSVSICLTIFIKFVHNKHLCVGVDCGIKQLERQIVGSHLVRR